MDLLCKRCQQPVPAENINVAEMVAKCARCHALFGFAMPQKEAGLARRERQAVPLPERFHVFRNREPLPTTPMPGDGPYRSAPARPDAETVAVEWRWFRPMHIFMIVFMVGWYAFLFFFASGAPDDTMFRLVPLIMGAAGLVMVYHAICGFTNRTRVAVEGDELVIQHGPMPWPGNRRFPTRDIAQLYGKEVVTTRRDNKGRRHHSTHYELRAADKAGRDVRLLRCEASEQVLFLEELFEKHLGIEDRHVAGELSK